VLKLLLWQEIATFLQLGGHVCCVLIMGDSVAEGLISLGILQGADQAVP